MSATSPEVVVVGAGITGLCAATRLAELGLRVQIWTAQHPRDTTSAAAGAIWDPLFAHHPCVPRWAQHTLDTYIEMACDEATGVQLIPGIEATRSGAMSKPTGDLPGLRECATAELPRGFASGWRYAAPIIDMSRHLSYLIGRLYAAGGTIDRRSLSGLELPEVPILVNCTGIGARRLVPDPLLRPLRGQLVAVANPGIDEFFVEQYDGLRESTYLLPQREVLLLGGSAELGESKPVPNMEVARRILVRCAEIEPAVAAAEVLGHRVGVRPFRPEVRLEHVVLDGRHIVHNYGHSGSGVSLSWGCAEDVAEIVMNLLS